MKTLFEIESAYAAALRAAGLDSFDAIMNMRGGPAVSKHRHRETVPVEIAIDGQPRKFFLKRVFKVPPKHAIWPLFSGRANISQPRNEWNVLAELKKLDILAMQRVAYGEQRIGGRPTRAFILVEAVTMQFTVEDLLLRVTDPLLVDKAWRDRLIWEMGSLIGTLHGNDLSWPDLQAKHIFAEIAGKNWRLQIIDVERIRKCRLINNGKLALSRIPDLSRLRESLITMQMWRQDYFHLISGYREALASAKKVSPKSISLSVRPRDWSFLAGRRPHWDESLTPFSAQRFDTIPGGFADSRYLRQLQSLRLASLENVFEFLAPETFNKPGLMEHRNRASFIMTDAQGQEQTFFLKRYGRPPLRERIRQIVEYDRKHSVAWRERHFIKRLNQTGICTPQIIAFGEEMRGLFELRSFLITEKVPGRSLEKHCEAVCGGKYPAPARQRIAMIEELARLVHLMHVGGLFHRDLYFSHVFLEQNQKGWPILYLIDLARMIERPFRSFRWRIKDLAALEYSAPRPLITRADRIRFLKCYDGGFSWKYCTKSGRRMMRKEEIRYYVRHILARSRRISRHDARKRERNANT